MQREFPETPLVGVGAVIVDGAGCCWCGAEPSRCWVIGRFQVECWNSVKR